jgi:hypothetical protein
MHQRPEASLFVRNPALRLVLGHALLGSLLGLAFAVALVATDAHGLGTLMRGSDTGVLAFLLLAGGFVVTFGSLVAGGAVMLLGEGSSGGGGLRGPAPALVPIPVRARRRARRD